jgi:hypothetical protein
MTDIQILQKNYHESIESGHFKFLSDRLPFPIKKVSFDGEKVNVDYDNPTTEKEQLITGLVQERNIRLEMVIQSRMNHERV